MIDKMIGLLRRSKSEINYKRLPSITEGPVSREFGGGRSRYTIVSFSRQPSRRESRILKGLGFRLTNHGDYLTHGRAYVPKAMVDQKLGKKSFL